MKYSLTYKDALEMVKVHKNFNFSKIESKIDGYRVVSFKYFLCEYNHFENPLPLKPVAKGFDMRGVTFVFNKDGSLYKKFLMLPKFFNLDQVESTLYHNVKDKKIKSITEKEDGSLVAFMHLPNDKVFAKTIGSFDNEQINAAMKIFTENHMIELLVRVQLEVGCTPLFEYVSWDNRIVLKYSKPELRFIGSRDNKTGFFHSAAGFYINKVKTVKAVKDITLDELIEKSKFEKDKEGQVVEFEDGQMIKIKTDWYWNLHGLRTVNIFREDFIIKNYLEEKLDDIVSQLDYIEDEDAFKFIDNVKLAVNKGIKYIDETVKLMVERYDTVYEKDWVRYATIESKNKYFALSKVMIYNPEDFNKKKIEYLINNTKRLKEARNFIDKWSEIKCV